MPPPVRWGSGPNLWLPLLIAAVLLGGMPAAGHADLVLNEFMASNDTTYSDELGEFDDWIEILNNGPLAVDLTGMYLTDDLTQTIMWAIPLLVLGPGERAIFWADSEVLQGPLHTTFKLNAAGEELGLFDTIPNGNLPLDTVVFGEQVTDVSYGRFPDGSGPWIYMPTATPAAANLDEGNVSPLISDTQNVPLSPAQGEVVVVTTYMRDVDGLITAATLYYDGGGGFVATGLFDDGLHGDLFPNDGIYGGEIPGFPTGTSVAYYVECVDGEAAVTTDPNDAPLTTFGYQVEYVAPLLFINEFMASNDTTIADNFGEFDDWVEVYNGDSAAVDLEGMGLSDDLADPDKYIFPAVVLEPQDFLLIWCDNDVTQGANHAGFKLSATGEAVGLFASAAEGFAPIDTLSFGQQVTDVSYGRDPDGGELWRFFQYPTPGAPNIEPNAIGETSSPPAAGFRLEAPRPNPTSGAGEAGIVFSLERGGRTVVRLFDVQGRLLRTILDQSLPAGEHHRRWDGRDAAGRRLATGVYFLQLETGGAHRSERLVILR